MKLTWPEPMPEQGRLSTGESDAAWASGVCLVVAPKLSCQQVLNITFDIPRVVMPLAQSWLARRLPI